MQHAIGWTASAVLLAMIATQIARQWRAGTSHGVSRWLFVGQLVASSLFVIYSALVKDVIFVATNALMAVGAAAGLGLLLWHRRQGK